MTGVQTCALPISESTDGSSDNSSSPAEAAEEQSEWSFLTTGCVPADSTPVQAKTAPKEEATSQGNSSLTAAEDRSEWTFTALEPNHAESAASTNGHNTTRKGPVEIRKYKGAIYEKGEDGQWHLQKK